MKIEKGRLRRNSVVDIGRPKGIRRFRFLSSRARGEVNRILRRSARPAKFSAYQLPGCMNLDTDPSLQLKDLAPRFEEGFEQFKVELGEVVDSKLSRTYFKFGDGDYHFLRKSEFGSAQPGARALSRDYDEIDHDSFVSGAKRCDRYMCEIYPKNRLMFTRTFGERKVDFPAEYVYAAVASRWITRRFAGNIGLIGAGPKLDLIRDLLTHPLYQDFLGIDDFVDYVSIPEKFACDDLEATITGVAKQLASARASIFLLGVGHVKSGLLWKLPEFHNAVYLDVGSGIDALAGIVDRGRPYFGGWLNFRLPERARYDDIDFLQLQNSGNVALLQRPFSLA